MCSSSHQATAPTGPGRSTPVPRRNTSSRGSRTRSSSTWPPPQLLSQSTAACTRNASLPSSLSTGRRSPAPHPCRSTRATSTRPPHTPPHPRPSTQTRAQCTCTPMCSAQAQGPCSRPRTSVPLPCTRPSRMSYTSPHTRRQGTPPQTPLQSQTTAPGTHTPSRSGSQAQCSGPHRSVLPSCTSPSHTSRTSPRTRQAHTPQQQPQQCPMPAPGTCTPSRRRGCGPRRHTPAAATHPRRCACSPHTRPPRTQRPPSAACSTTAVRTGTPSCCPPGCRCPDRSALPPCTHPRAAGTRPSHTLQVPLSSFRAAAAGTRSKSRSACRGACRGTAARCPHTQPRSPSRPACPHTRRHCTPPAQPSQTSPQTAAGSGTPSPPSSLPQCSRPCTSVPPSCTGSRLRCPHTSDTPQHTRQANAPCTDQGTTQGSTDTLRQHRTPSRRSRSLCTQRGLPLQQTAAQPRACTSTSALLLRVYPPRAKTPRHTPGLTLPFVSLSLSLSLALAWVLMVE